MAYIRRKRKKWQVLIRKRFAKNIAKTFVLKEDAERYARETEAQIDKGIFVTYEEAQKTKLSELLERYRTEITSKKKGATVEDFKIKYLQTLPIADNYLISVTPTKIAKLRDALLADRKPGTVCKYLAFISNCWNVARKEWGINLPDNPVSLIKKPVVKDRRDRVLTPAEYEKLLHACSLSKLYSMKGMVIFAYTTGARYGEILKLQKKDVDFIKRTMGLVEEIEDWIKNTPDAKLVIIDPYVKVKKTLGGHKLNAYENDNYNLQDIYTLANKYNIAIVFIHHTKKKSEDDVFDEINGSAGIQSNCDSMIVISSNRRIGTNPVLSCLPKDAEHQEFEISLNPKCIWEYVGKPGEANRTKLQTTILAAFKKLDKPDGVKVGDIKDEVRIVDDSWSPEHVQMGIDRLHKNDEILKIKRGIYKVVPF